MMGNATAIVVIGASAGGVDAIRALAAALPANFAAAVCVVLHIGAHKSELPWLLNQAGPLPACHPADGDPADAADPGMPRSAIKHVVIDHCLPLSGISALLSSLAGTRGAKAPVERVRPAASGEGGG